MLALAAEKCARYTQPCPESRVQVPVGVMAVIAVVLFLGDGCGSGARCAAMSGGRNGSRMSDACTPLHHGTHDP